MNSNGKRVIGYGTGLVVAAGLIYGGFVFEAEPEVGTLLSSVEVQIRLAGALPPEDKQGKPVQARQDLIVAVRQELDRIEQMDPSVVEVHDYRAYVDFLEGKFEDAAMQYRELRGHEKCSGELLERSVINEARMLRMAGRSSDAKQLLEQHRDAVSAEFAKSVRDELATMEASQTPSESQTSAQSAAVPSK